MTILQSLVALYARLEKRGEIIPKSGYAPVRIGFLLELDYDGTPRALIDKRDHSGHKPVAPSLLMPEVSRTSGIRPAFLWDKSAYALGVTRVEVENGAEKRIIPGQGKRTRDEHEAFKAEHLDALRGNEDEGLTALTRFLTSWSPEEWETSDFRNDEALDEQIAFCLKGEHQRIDERPAARAVIAARSPPSGAQQLCLVSGASGVTRSNHPQFKGVTGAQSSGAAIVSFNADAFESYGKKKSANAPVSEDAAFKYGAALNWLLDRANARAFRLGETTVVFWADERPETGGEDAAAAAEDVIWHELGSGEAVDREADASEDADETWQDDEAGADRDLDAADAGRIRSEMANVAGLRAAPDRSKLQPETRVHILGLSPNSGRIAVRFYLVNTFGHLEKNLARHRQDMEIAPAPANPNQKGYALLYETAVQRKAENIPPRLGGELAKAILSGSPYPRTMLAAVVGRIRADKSINATRAAICKAIITRNLGEEDFPVALNPDSDDSPYNLGRLFAAYEYAERAVADRNATIRDKYIGAASATPRRVFPILMRGYEHNASALAKGEGNQRGSGVKAARTVAQILGRFGGEMPFPTALKLEEQSRFFVGYYHQMAALYTKIAKDNDSTEGDDR